MSKEPPAGYPNLTGTHPRTPKLSALHKAVVDAFEENGFTSKRQAMRDAGFAETTACSNPQSVFARPEVQIEIQVRKIAQGVRTELTKEYIQERMLAIAEFNGGDVAAVLAKNGGDLEALTDDQLAGLSVEVQTTTDHEGNEARLTKVKPAVSDSTRLSALRELGKLNGHYVEKVEVSGEVSLIDRIQKARKALATDEAAPDGE